MIALGPAEKELPFLREFQYSPSVGSGVSGSICFVTPRPRHCRRRCSRPSNMRESREYYRRLFNSMLNGLAHCRVLTDGPPPHDFVYLEVNPAFESLTGLKNVVGKRVSEVIPGIRETDPELLNLYDKVALTGEPQRFETYVEALKMWFSVSVYSPEKSHFVALFDVITEQKRVAEELRRSEERFRALIEKSTDLIVVLDAAGHVQFLSPSVTEELGWRSEEVLGTSVLAYVHPDDQQGIIDVIASVLPTPRAIGNVSAHLRHQDGGWHLIEATGRNYLDDPAVQGIVVNARDVTKQRQMEEQFHHAQKLESVGRLAGGVAHDFNNLLTVILSAAEELKHDLHKGSPADAELVEEIVAAGGRARALTRHLLAFARKQVVAPVVLDLNEVVRGSEHMLRRVVGEDIDLTVDLQPGLWSTFCDPGQVEQVLLNLVVNSRDAMPSGGRLRIGTQNADIGPADVEAATSRRLGQWVRLSVADSGLGMSPDAKAHLFEPFFTTKPAGKGTGLGLATVYGIVRQFGGHLHVLSEPGQGATFEIWLPRRSGPVDGTTPPPTGDAVFQQGTETILLVEDDPAVRQLAARALRTAGHPVLVAANGQDVRNLGSDDVDRLQLLVTDVLLPGQNGREIAEELRRRHAGLPVLYISGYTQDAFDEGGAVGERARFLPKPFTPSELLVRVRELLDLLKSL
jgi:two-component system cell cycle sensor histidine kinase/response regulator CckA